LSTDQTESNDPNTAETADKQQAPPLFYSDPAPVNGDIHGDFKIQPEGDFRFTKDTNAVPITTPEFVLAARHYPIVFVGDQMIPTVVLGFRQGQNLFVADDGTWERRCYIPAYVRRYPFILLGKEDDERLQLGVDGTSKSDHADARALFDGEKKETQVVTDALDICQQFHGAYKTTSEFSEMLADSGLMEERSLELEFPGAEKMSIGSFSSVDEQKLRDASGERFLEWRRKGWLAAMYFHVASLNNWEQLIDRMPEAQPLLS
jgi:hypothetical protein